MSRPGSQLANDAVRNGAHHAGGALLILGRVLLALALLACLAVGVLAWRLSTGPIALPWLAARIASAASTPTRTVTIGSLAISWGGFAHRDEPPLGLHLTDVHAHSAAGQATIGRADIVLPLGKLLTGTIAPSTASISAVDLRLSAAAAKGGAGQGGAGQGGGSKVDVTRVLRLLTDPSEASGRGWTQLRHLHVHDVQLQAAGVAAKVTKLDIDLDRVPSGGITGLASGVLEASGQQATLTLAALLPDDETGAPGAGTTIHAALTSVTPAALAGTAPETAFLSALDAPVTMTANVLLGPMLTIERANLALAAGSGTIHAGDGTAPLLGAVARFAYRDRQVELTLDRLDTAADQARPTRFSGHATGRRDGAGFAVSAALAVDHVAFADLAVLWPAGVGGKGTRPWITGNITAGELADGHATVELTIPGDLSDVVLHHLDAALDGHDITAHWLRPVPPMEHAEAHMTATDPDVIDIIVASARQAGGTHGGIAYKDGLIHLTGIASPNQYADIRTGLVGTLPDLLAVLNHPRIKLLDKRPIPMRDPAGEVTAELKVGHLPLRDDVAMEDLAIQTSAHFTGVHLGGIAAGYDLSDGRLDLTASNDGLDAAGTGALAGFPSRVKIGMDFRGGPPTQVQQSVDIHATVALPRLQEFGLPVAALGGSAELIATLEARRDGRTQIGLQADLAQATLSEPRMGMDKQAGSPGSAAATVTLQDDHLAAIDAVRVSAPGIDVRGHADIANGHPDILRLERIAIGADTEAAGEIRLARGGSPLDVRLSGSSLDLSAALHGMSKPAPPATSGRDAPGAPWRADLRFERVILTPARALTAVTAVADSDGSTLTQAKLSGQAAGSTFRADIVPEPGGRRLTADVPDAGALVQAAAGSDALIGGRLHVVGRWADRLPGRPLRGVAEMADFRVRDAPAIGRVLQGLTVYGLLELAQGPGLGFTTLVAPFTLTGKVLELHESQAFSASLGMTAQGRLDFGRRTAALNGTVVPAYFFNSLLGRVPVLGRLFTAEKGGGLFAAAVTVHGPLDDLDVHVNPLSALTPGFLRGLFGTARPPGGG